MEKSSNLYVEAEKPSGYSLGTKQPGAFTADSPSCLSSAICLSESLNFLTYNTMSQGCIKLLQSLADIQDPPLLPCFLPQPSV